MHNSFGEWNIDWPTRQGLAGFGALVLQEQAEARIAQERAVSRTQGKQSAEGECPDRHNNDPADDDPTSHSYPAIEGIRREVDTGTYGHTSFIVTPHALWVVAGGGYCKLGVNPACYVLSDSDRSFHNADLSLSLPTSPDSKLFQAIPMAGFVWAPVDGCLACS